MIIVYLQTGKQHNIFGLHGNHKFGDQHSSLGANKGSHGKNNFHKSKFSNGKHFYPRQYSVQFGHNSYSPFSHGHGSHYGPFSQGHGPHHEPYSHGFISNHGPLSHGFGSHHSPFSHGFDPHHNQFSGGFGSHHPPIFYGNTWNNHSPNRHFGHHSSW